ncbi:MAG: hypothetical protein ABSC37_03110 [Xanthobacteraceae bacterium]
MASKEVKPHKWQPAGCHTLPAAGLPMQGNTDEAIYNRVCLILEANRHCAEFWDDDDVSAELQTLRDLRMPWEL